MKKILIVFCAIALMLTAACSTPEAPSDATPSGGAAASAAPAATDAGATTEVARYKVMVQRKPDDGNWDDLWLTKLVEEKFGIKLDATEVTTEGWEEKKNLAFATNALPDLFGEGLTDFDVITYGSNGTLIDLKDLIYEHAPNVVSLYEQRPDFAAAITAPGGSIYSARGITTTPREQSRARVYVNTDWIETLGMTIPTNLDELYDVLVAFKNGDPNQNGIADEIPMGGRASRQNTHNENGRSIAAFILSAFGLADERIVVDESGKVLFVPEQEGYRQYLIYMNRLYSEGLLDQEYYSQAEDQRVAKTSSGLYGVFPTTGANWSEIKEEELNSQYNCIPPLTSSINSQQIWPAYDMRLTSDYAITSICQDPVPLMKLYNWLMSEEGSMAQRMGSEVGDYDEQYGIQYVTRDGIEGLDLLFPAEKYASFNQFRSKEMTTQKFPYYWPYDVPLHIRFDERQVDLTNQIIDNYGEFYKVAFPTMFLSVEATDEIGMIEADLDSYLRQMEGQFVTGVISLDEFDSFVKGCSDRNSGRYVEIKQQAYDRYLENMK
ncbi:MAG: hypothetical protein ACOX8S_04390 [Christensenellales bacterium]|jgi:putative aldouronate transport system substrate-binding protein